MTEKKTLYCSFCGKSQFEVAKLIAGPAAFICNECVKLCTDICEPLEMRELRRWSIEKALPCAQSDVDQLLHVAGKIEAYVSAKGPASENLSVAPEPTEEEN